MRKTIATTRHQFHNSAETQFRELLCNFHEQYNTQLVMCGVDDPGCDLQQVKMSRLNHDTKLCERLMGGMLEHKPNIHIMLHDEKEHVDFELFVTQLNDPHATEQLDMTGVWLHQVAYDYPREGKCLYQFWQLDQHACVESINNLWYGTQ